MKRNLVPLLGIAVVVAILSTGVFYGLFAGKLHSASADITGQPIVVAAHDLERGKVLDPGDLKITQFKGSLAGSFSRTEQAAGGTLIAAVKQNEPLLEERVITNSAAGSSTNSSVPTGLRALSVHITDSDGVVGLLRPGAKVDIQAVQERTGGPALRTILQNIEVVSVNPPQPAAGNRGPVSIVTVLVKPEDGDTLAVADSGARLRLALRNPLDEQSTPRRALSVGAVFQPTAAVEAAPRTYAGYTPAGSLQVEIKVLRASAAAASELESKLDRAASGNSPAVAGVTSGGNELIEKLASQHEIAILAQRKFNASAAHPAWFRTGPAAGQLGLEMFPQAEPGGKPSLKIRQEVVSLTSAGAETKRYETGVAANGSFLLRGVLSEARDREILERIFPGNSWSGEKLLIEITARETSDLTARHDRGR